MSATGSAGLERQSAGPSARRMVVVHLASLRRAERGARVDVDAVVSVAERDRVTDFRIACASARLAATAEQSCEIAQSRKRSSEVGGFCLARKGAVTAHCGPRPASVSGKCGSRATYRALTREAHAEIVSIETAVARVRLPRSGVRVARRPKVEFDHVSRRDPS